MQLNVYVPVEQEPYKCILAVPISSSLQENCHGVLNIDANRANSLGEIDFQYAEVAAALIGLGLDVL